MDDFYSSIWLHQESIDEISQNLQNTLFELETLKMEANEKTRTHTEEVNQLITLLKSTQQERDEARQQLSQFLIQTQNTNSRTTTESNSLSPQGSSSPLSSSVRTIHHPQPSMILEDPTAQNHHQPDPLDILVMGKAFPETGKLLKAVVEAGPLLQTLLVAGTLPKWVNPPPQTESQRFELPPLTPPVSSKGRDDVSSSGASGRCDSLMCSGSVMRFGLDQTMVTGKKQRLE
ncbi:hypothetical protein Rs2_40140 [Raphanus sativus]|uniref:Uncharacterized protein LOC108825937 isoform X2 n=1 Tax=Raphanus sativus TaxID=3726 RepID=A0A6J0L5H6_RAPSA|nr:uncharacterized protein LOC108825937 isoform X2 [Raphanus sativus]KAJ4875122.1 hypothetical protein Rs2_40140 [Raphanus sativus]